MARPLWEMADVIRMAVSKFWDGLGKTLTWAQVKAFYAIVRCRTAALSVGTWSVGATGRRPAAGAH